MIYIKTEAQQVLGIKVDRKGVNMFCKQGGVQIESFFLVGLLNFHNSYLLFSSLIQIRIKIKKNVHNLFDKKKSPE